MVSKTSKIAHNKVVNRNQIAAQVCVRCAYTQNRSAIWSGYNGVRFNMKNLLLPLVSALILTACASNSKKDELIASESVSHTAIMGISAFYYCAHGHWPKFMNSIRKYEEAKQVMSHVDIQWDRLERHATYAYEPTYQVESKVPLPGGETITVTSGQEPPLCERKEVELQGAYVEM